MTPQEQIYHLGVKAIIRRPDGKVLAIKKDGSEIFWDLPGGRVRKGESPFDALNREVKEEVGPIPLAHILPNKVVVTPIHVNQTDVKLILWFFTCETDDDRVHLDHTEFSRYEWASWSFVRDQFLERGIEMPDI